MNAAFDQFVWLWITWCSVDQMTGVINGITETFLSCHSGLDPESSDFFLSP